MLTRGGTWQFALYASVLALAVGCGGGSGGGGSGTSTAKHVKVRGTQNTGLAAPGGLKPIAGSKVVAYQAGGSVGDHASQIGGAVTNHATQIGEAVTDKRGTFDLTFDPPPSDGGVVYIVASGGDAGSGPNSAIAMVSVQGVFCEGEDWGSIPMSISPKLPR